MECFVLAAIKMTPLLHEAEAETRRATTAILVTQLECGEIRSPADGWTGSSCCKKQEIFIQRYTPMYVLNMLDYVCGGLRLKGKGAGLFKLSGAPKSSL